ncbi:ABC transporter substrate-binding protein [Roseomonas stagni]|uniref:ABC transporter substrate-binding protein n=1 Tax=Falsiroseomonas algicola TaxID=2716930 RepID=A0A6M1LEI9_9PROT|nr:ABC transporter substrate-binding protein [Falsiroseomonas algicola]NGM18621.1 ABC transporter substrate-binding protein [Falsiroseomonas algicola]
MRTRYRIERRALLTGGTAFTLAAVAGARVPLAQTLEKVSFQTNWRAQAEHGGYYHAVASGIYRRYGIDCEIRMGGPQQNPSQLLLAGRVDFIMSNGFQALNYVRENLPFLTIGAIMQKDPQILMTHEGNGINSFEDMRGRPILIGASGRVTYWPFLRRRFGFTDEQIRPYTFNVGPFLADRMAIQQGFVSSEPFAAMQAGARPKVFLIADAGYNNYNTTIDVSRRMVTEKRDLVQRFVSATMEGWTQYLAGGDISAANALIKRDNPEMDDAKIAYAIQVMNSNGIVMSGDSLNLGCGAMTDARWQSFYEGMRDVGLYPAGMNFRQAYSLDFVNKRVGLA